MTTESSSSPSPEGTGSHSPDTGQLRSAAMSQEPRRTARLRVISASLLVALGGLLYGYDTGVISGTLAQITDDYGVSEHGVTAEFITSFILAGAVVGALGASFFARRFGRRVTIMAVASVFVAGVVFCAISPNPYVMMASRFFLGLAVGGSTQTIPTYISELAPKNKRGSYVTFFNIAIGVGILSAALVNFFLRDVEWHWKIVVAAIPAIVLVLGMIPLPESPRWLVSKGEVDTATEVLEWVRPSEKSAKKEIREIEKTRREEQRQAAKSEWSAMLSEKWMRPAIIAGVAVAVFTQITGLEMMIYYTPTLLTHVGLPSDIGLSINVMVGLVYVVMTAIGRFIVDRMGRRTLMLWTLPFAALWIALFGLTLFMGGDHPNIPLMLIFLMLFMVFQAGGIQVVGWLMGSELYPLKIRTSATSLHAMALWGSNLVVTSTALTLVNFLSPGGAMMVYAALNVIAWIVIYYRVPETRGRSLEDIESSLHEGDFLPLERKRLAREGAELH